MQHAVPSFIKAFLMSTALVLTACGGGGSTSNPTTVAPPPPPTNVAPTFTSPNAVSIEERQDEAYRAEATDGNGDTLSFSINGMDSGQFSINTSSGAVTFLQTADFENPTDSDGNNVYDIVVTVSDSTETVEQPVQITVTDVYELTNIDLTTLSAEQGLIIQGAMENHSTGISVSSAGDINADGFDDIVIGAPRTFTPPGGVAYVVFGAADNLGVDVNGRQTLDLANLSSTDGFVIRGGDAGDRIGDSVSNVGDVNGDTIDDLIIGAPFGDLGGFNAGEAYVIFGSNNSFGLNVNGQQVIDLATLSPNAGFIIQGEQFSTSIGSFVSGKGDVNGDGIADIIIGAPQGRINSNFVTGGVYIVFGSTGVFGTETNGRRIIDLTTFTAEEGFSILGSELNSQIGISVSSSGDVNSDGISDIIIGASTANKNALVAGKAYVVFGSMNILGVNTTGRQILDLASLSPTEGFAIPGVEFASLTGQSVSTGADINADGFDDILIGAPSADSFGVNSGETYVVFGNTNNFGDIVNGQQELDLSALSMNEGFVIQSNQSMDTMGASVSSAGDINADGFDDIIIGAPGDVFTEGKVYILFGGTTDFSIEINGRQVFDLTTLPSEKGIIIQGDELFDRLGTFVSSAGDINSDGFDDIIVGAPGGDDGGTDAGEAYVIFGAPVQ